MKNMKKLTLVALFTLVLAFAGCASKPVPTAEPEATVETAPALVNGTVVITDGATYGEGATSFTFAVTDLDNNTVSATVNTDKATVGEALIDNQLVAGETSEWGLMVNTINGITLNYDADHKYWAFYINDEYASTGVDSTEVTAGATYSFVPAE